ncbi:pseudouridine-5'-phosphate glycosidase [Shewanella sp. VB17]|uniref:pseudouridine-5'-phosphate glycosidase n=1 Tax=Shewanella sp. VB17 TaxID=2739432 RepID=UPI0015634A7B|nr:pseudouridine-5'-phosphate glycosidase [Shewanella sp. VB17]NRD73441.1 pseudouridine-5'-phosphate glycosidase [Shewanella sp. VB17]
MLAQYLDIKPEVAAALTAGEPVVALESTIITHGMPYPPNVETALRVEQIIRDHGAIPATIAILKGKLKVGMTPLEVEYLGKAGLDVIKTSRRDIPFIVAKQADGATTVASTMILASMAGIKVFATGGIGGVHRDAQQTFDISADLQELANTDVAVVCAGAKSILDIGLTLEYLETQGVPVIGYQTDTLPAFYTRESDFSVDYRLDSAEQIAAALTAKWQMGLKGGVVIANPIPAMHQLDRGMIDDVIVDALAQMKQQGISGKASTPFLLTKVAEKTHGKSLKANIELVLNNAKLAAEIAIEYAK